MNPLLFCFITTCIIVYIWDYTGFVQTAANNLSDVMTKGRIKHVEIRKPLGCSLCMTQWFTLIFLLCVSPYYFWMSFVFSWSTQYIILLYNLIDKALIALFRLIENNIL